MNADRSRHGQTSADEPPQGDARHADGAPGGLPAHAAPADAHADEDAGSEGPSRGAAIAMYLVCLAVAIGFVLGPLATYIIWRVRRDEAFLDLHGRQALDIVLTALLVGGGLYFIGRLIREAQDAAGSVIQWLAIGVVLIQAALLFWGMIEAVRGRSTLLPASLRLLRRGSMG